MDEVRQTKDDAEVNEAGNTVETAPAAVGQKIDKDDTLFTSATSEMPA
jgi:hypothetical protein